MTAALTYTTSTQLEELSCGVCGVVFAVVDNWVDARRRDHNTWYCPNGHPRYFPGKSDVERERERRISAEAKAARMEDRAEITERRRRAEKGQRTRLLNRIRNGVCPHCNRSFADLAAHIQTKHAEVPSTP